LILDDTIGDSAGLCGFIPLGLLPQDHRAPAYLTDGCCSLSCKEQDDEQPKKTGFFSQVFHNDFLQVFHNVEK